MSGFRTLLEVLISGTVDVAGNGAVHSGKGLLVAGARKIGWASGGSASRQGKRFAGHSIASRSLGSGFGGSGRSRTGAYNPAAEYQSRTLNSYHQAMKCGTGVQQFAAPQRNAPSHLFGRPGFEAPQSKVGRNDGNRFCRHQSDTRGQSWSKNPRGHIKF
ncbi:MAG: hypothetical protein KDD69_01170 [Bdellovibrionales bacterium]|nr:hypothetical protein [Bdellovibrionales bacterium]